MKHDKIAVIDFGGQFCHLIATKIRKLEVLAEIKDPCDNLDSFRQYKGIILSGSPSLASEGEGAGYTTEIFDLEIPILGFCFGHQEIAKHYGGRVDHCAREYGFARLHIVHQSEIFHGLGPEEQVWMSHGDTVTDLPAGFVELAWSAIDEQSEHHHNAAIADHLRQRYGFQYHPEVDDTIHGAEMLANFVFRICGCRPTWRIDDYVEEQIRSIRDETSSRDVFLLASGGVDSTVAAQLIERSLGGDRLHLLHIDNGLMRKDESRQVLEVFRQHGMGKNLHFVDASETFLQALDGVTEPEEKREIIGNTFIEVFNRESIRLGLDNFLLGQGTIYPDTIETGGTSRADVIKTHHNRVEAVQRMVEAGQVIEPLKDLYKSEVRDLGVRLGLPDALVYRHPFPGPGLGIRVLCSAGSAPPGFDPESVSPILDELSKPHDLSATLLPLQSVGVKADVRSYEFPVLLRGSALPWKTLTTVAGAVCQRAPGVNRCIYGLFDEEVSTVEVCTAAITRARLDLLREFDHQVMSGLARHGLMNSIWQCPTVLVPLAINGKGSEFVVVRPIHSERAMTAIPAEFPEALIGELKEAILPHPQVSGLAIDITSKPPGTIEWE